MAGAKKTEIMLSNDSTHALVAYLVKRYNEVSNNTLGRIILQKLCYFAKASGVQLQFQFEIYHYGPFSQEIFDVTDDLKVDGVITDSSEDLGKSAYVEGPNCRNLLQAFDQSLAKNKPKLDRVAIMFSKLNPSQMELVSTVHYIHNSYRVWFKNSPIKKNVVQSVVRIKGKKFPKEDVSQVFDMLVEARLIN
jgi:uncharacterized protein